jgi:hypothetical protein
MNTFCIHFFLTLSAIKDHYLAMDMVRFMAESQLRSHPTKHWEASDQSWHSEVNLARN